MSRYVLTIPGRLSQGVDTLRDASEAYAAVREESGEGASTFPEGVVRAGHRAIARVSYNAKVFASASTRWVEEVAPAIESYANKSTAGITQAIEDARKARISGDPLDEFLRKRFTRGQAEGIKAAHLAEEDRPIESLWDVTVGATAYAKGVKHQDDRVDIEREAGKIMAMASK